MKELYAMLNMDGRFATWAVQHSVPHDIDLNQLDVPLENNLLFRFAAYMENLADSKARVWR